MVITGSCDKKKEKSDLANHFLLSPCKKNVMQRRAQQIHQSSQFRLHKIHRANCPSENNQGERRKQIISLKEKYSFNFITCIFKMTKVLKPGEGTANSCRSTSWDHSGILICFLTLQGLNVNVITSVPSVVYLNLWLFMLPQQSSG